jgi:hypothetical protein
MTQPDDGGGWRSSMLKYGVPIAILAVAIWGWKSRKPAPQATIVSRTVFLPTGSSDDSSGPGRVALSAPPAAASAGAPSRSAEQLFAEVSGSIVRVVSSDSSGRETKQGSGVVTGSGRVITNCHVTQGAAKVTVKIGTSSKPASVSVADEELDLCALDVGGLDAPAVSVGSVASLRTGQRVYAIGAPMGLDLTISEGIVSSLREASGSKVIQTTAPVSPGSSGGGLFNADGALVGIVTYQHRYGQNLNFAVPADWIGEMRTRTAASAAVMTASAELSVGEMVVGKWWCFGTLSGRNGEYDYRADGELRFVHEGRKFAGPYRVAGRRIVYQITEDRAVSLDIESISRERMVQVVGEGQRLACERR